MNTKRFKNLIQTKLAGELRKRYEEYLEDGLTSGGAARQLVVRGMKMLGDGDLEIRDDDGDALRVQTNLSDEQWEAFEQICFRHSMPNTTIFRELIRVSLTEINV